MTNLSVEMQNLLDDYVQEVQDAVKDAAKEAAELTAKQLQKTSPKRIKGKGKGKYARGWRVKKHNVGINTGYIVYNGAQPGLTQLLENGHVARNQFGTYGRVRAIKHIGPAADAGIQRFELSIKARLRK